MEAFGGSEVPLAGGQHPSAIVDVGQRALPLPHRATQMDGASASACSIQSRPSLSIPIVFQYHHSAAPKRSANRGVMLLHAPPQRGAHIGKIGMESF